MAKNAMLIDTSKCIACRGCQVACKEWNDLRAGKTKLIPGTYQNPPAIAANTWTIVRYSEKSDDNGTRWLFRKEQCLHCDQASCVEVCPTGAMAKHYDEFVEVDQEWCIGCRYCVQACPFGAVQFDETTGTVKKCTLCIDRVLTGLEPACVKACPSGALSFGDREKLLTVARGRVDTLRARGSGSSGVYGKDELGGLKVIYILNGPPVAYGLAPNPQVATASLSSSWLSGLLATGVLASLPFWFLFRRKRELAAETQEVLPTTGGE